MLKHPFSPLFDTVLIVPCTCLRLDT